MFDPAEQKHAYNFLSCISGPNSVYLRDDLFKKTTVTVRGGEVWIDCVFENYVTISWYKDTVDTVEISNNSE